jgi:hypothetical protein
MGEAETRERGVTVGLSADWRKSSFSDTNGCVEVALLNGRVAVRDSKDRNGPVLEFEPSAWAAFLEDARTGRFDPTSHQS